MSNTIVHICEKYQNVLAMDSGMTNKHAANELCFFKNNTFNPMSDLCKFCTIYEKTYIFLLVQNAKKNHKQKFTNIHSLIRSIPPQGVDYLTSVNKYAKIMKKC